MPTYEYICEKCNHQFELLQRITDQALTVCPREKCGRKSWGKGKVKRMIVGGAGLLFKGSGFYITDYRSENYKAGEKKESGASASTPAEGKSAPAEGKSGTAEGKAGAPQTPAGDKKPAAPAPSAPAPAPAKTEPKPKGGRPEKS